MIIGPLYIGNRHNIFKFKPMFFFFFDFKKVPSNINWQGSAHEVEMLQTLNMIDMNKDLPKTMVLGVIPKRISDDTTFDLSDEIINAVNVMENRIIGYLIELNIECKVINKDISIEDISLVSFKREIKNYSKVDIFLNNQQKFS